VAHISAPLPNLVQTLDEVAVIKELMYWAAPKAPAPMGTRLQVRSVLMGTNSIAALQSITREELAVLAPHIDEWIAGELPAQNLPAEYEDYRPRVLLGLKQRLQSEGRWPLAISRKRIAAPQKAGVARLSGVAKTHAAARCGGTASLPAM
jgi:hypothetical protein